MIDENQDYGDRALYLCLRFQWYRTLAHPVNPGVVEENRPGGGVNGTYPKEMADIVRNRSGYYRIHSINPVHNRTLESKRGYGVKIDERWWLGSGIYTGPDEPAAP